MCTLQCISTERSQLVSTLAGGSVEIYEFLLDYLISWDVLNWEEYENVSIVGQPLSKLVRDLLDVIDCKGENSCRLFNDALCEVNKVPQDRFCLQPPEDQSKLLIYLQRERPHIVRIIHDHVDAIFQHLLDHNCVSKYEVDVIRLPIYSPSQKARRLLDLLRGKGNESAQYLINYIHCLEKETHAPDICLEYQKKLKYTISAQSRFLSTYDGGENVCLEDIYTESILELPKNSIVSEPMQGLQNPLGLHDIFNAQGLKNENADTILVLGDAGSGKSTLLQQIHHLWAGDKAFQNFCFVFPFSCRRLCCVVKQVSLKTLLFEHCCWPDHRQEEIFQFILENPRQILITFDGFDEFKSTFTDDNTHCSPIEPTSIENIVFNLLQGNLMKGSIKLVTSRPDAITQVLQKYIQKEINLKGFSEEGIEIFMKKHHSDPNISREIISMVKANSSLRSLCSNPVFCWIVSKCHKELILNGCSSPQTMTDMYILTLQHFLLHAASGKKFAENVLEKRICSVTHLGKLALHGLCHGLYVFSYQQILGAEVNEEDLSLGFLVLSKNFSVNIKLPDQHYEFLHITFQCFFAALYIAMRDDVSSSSLHQLFTWTKNPTSEACIQKIPHLVVQRYWHKETDIMLQKIEKQNLQITANFVAGLFSQRIYDLMVHSWKSKKLPKKLVTIKKCLDKGIQKHFKSIPPAVHGEKKSVHALPEFVWLIKCIYEMQDNRLARSSVKGLEVDHLKITYCRIGPAECTALAFVLKHLKNPVGIELDYNSVGDIGIEQLIPCLHHCQALYLRDNNISDKGICKLMDQALHWQNFQKIALFNNKLTDKCADAFADLLKHKQNFLALRLGNNFITEIGAQVLAEGLRENQSIQFLGLWGNRVGDIGAQAIAEALYENKSLIWLSLVDNDIGSLGAQALASFLERNSALKELCLEENNLQDNDVILLANALKKNYTLKILKLKGINLTSDELQNIGKLDHRLFLKG
ncbi:nucleotide-binding oligomerization domain-containing protein 2 [Rhinophrynus dorsalis]